MLHQRQTISYLQKRFTEVGIHPEKGHGQNFLIDLNLVDLLVREARLGWGDVVLEVGTGTGSLTAMMAQAADWVITAEIDSRMFQLAREELADTPNVTMLLLDALHGKNKLSPEMMAAVRHHLNAVPERRLKLAANLPYNIATPLIANLLLGDLPFASMTVTIQKELADRITASPGTKDYSALTVFVQALADARIVRVLPPDVFWPRPRVVSAILEILPIPERRATFADLAFFHRFVKNLFLHRRKFLRSGLLSAVNKEISKPEIDALLAAQGLAPTARAEELSVDQLHRLSDAVAAKLGSTNSEVDTPAEASENDA